MSCNGNSLPLNQVLLGDCREVVAGFPEDSIDLVVTSPPYWGLRDYGGAPQVYGGNPKCDHQWGEEISLPKKYGGTNSSTLGEESWGNAMSDEAMVRSITRSFVDESKSNFCIKCGAWRGSLGLEPHPQMFVDHLVEASREIKRILKPRGSYWLNLGDTYYSSPSNQQSDNVSARGSKREPRRQRKPQGNWLQSKQLLGIPWRVAIALQDEGWMLRNCVIWYKRNHMPESVRDRLTKSYEFFFFLVKQPKYYFNLDAIRKPHKEASILRDKHPYTSAMRGRYQVPWEKREQIDAPKGTLNLRGKNPGDMWEIKEEKLTKHDRAVGRIGNFSYTDPLHTMEYHPKGKNPGDVWDTPTRPFPGAHFAVFPEELVDPIIKACCPPKGVVLDPFAGSGTSLRVARRLGRSFIGVEINPEYVELCLKRVKADGYRKPPEGVNPLSDYIDLYQANQKEEKEDV